MAVMVKLNVDMLGRGSVRADENVITWPVAYEHVLRSPLRVPIDPEGGRHEVAASRVERQQLLLPASQAQVRPPLPLLEEPQATPTAQTNEQIPRVRRLTGPT